MGETTPDIRQLSTCCGKPLVWRDYVTFDGRYSADCSGCGADLCVEAMEQARELTATEKLLLARIAELEAANAELMATLANERGEGDPPVEGWEWEPDEGAWVLWKDDGGFHATRTTKGWTWDGDRVSSGLPHSDTARAAIRAASAAISPGADAPKEQ